MTLRNNGVLSEDFVYNSAGQLTKTRGFSYTYDAAGQMLTRKYADGNTITNTYDADGRTSTMAADSTTTNYAYDPDGNLTRTTLPNTLIEDRAYDTAGRLTSVASTQAGAVITKTALTLSAAGQPTHIDTTRTGVATGGYDLTYDKAGRITAGCFPQPTVSGCADTRTTTYSCDKAGNRLTATLGTRNTSYSYDAADQLLSSTTGTTTTDYGYDGEGNQTKAGANTYTYDLAGQISAANVGGIAYAYQHDAEGNLVTTSQAGALTKRTEWDPNAPLPTLATEYDGTGAVQQSYRYDPLGQAASAKTGAGKVYTYTHDALGSPLDVTGSTGTVFQRWAYDPFGTRVRSTVTGGAPESAPSYAGAYFDTTTSYLDLRARQYDTFTGRFTRPDPLTPDTDTPYTQPYAYVENMPTSRVDPSGLCSVTTQMKDLFSGNWGWNNDCAKEDRETATESPAVQSAKNLSDNVTKAAIEAAGQAGLGLLDGLTLGGFSYFSGAQITCPPAYNLGYYASMVPFPVSGGGRGIYLLPKAINLPSWKTVAVDMIHVLERHTADGKIYKQSMKKTKFPDYMSPKKIESTIITAYRFAVPAGRSQGSRILLRGMAEGLEIEMWLDKSTKLIETAYPVWR
ncbi:RHS repeat-associated core domain-containing protein [Streptomyces sp. NPDC093544]|uniref:RHS repeat domain-containing protein n=1 Tax=Streptomyces sp. NPDC093544 TaxID=3155200 RepID=UPI003415735C